MTVTPTPPVPAAPGAPQAPEAAPNAAPVTPPAATPPAPQPTAAEAAAQAADTQLGDAGKRAIDAMKAERNEARDALKSAQDALAALQAQAAGKEAEHAAQVAAQKVKDEALAVANERILKAEIRAAAAGKLADPADALAYVDLKQFEVGENGDVDSTAVQAAIDELITKKPYLAAQGQRIQGGADNGARNDAGAPAQLTEADVKRLYAEKRYDEIEEARAKGQLKTVLGG